MLCARHLYRRRSFLTKAGAQCSWSDWPRSERCTGNYGHFSQRDVAKDGAETLRSSQHYPSNLYLCSQFDDPIGRNLEVISRVAGVARHRGIQGLPP